MNKHRARWSVMGMEQSNYFGERQKKLEAEINRIVDIYSFNEVATALRKRYEEREKND